MRDLSRRGVIGLVGGAAVWPLAARAQQPAMAWIGLLAAAHLDERQLRAIRQGLKEAGYIEGRNTAIKYLSADGRFERLPALAAELVSDPAAVIVAIAPPHRLGPCHHPQARAHDGRRCDGDERAGQGFGVHGALAGRRS